MCLQDLAITQGLRLRQITLTTDGNGDVMLERYRTAVQMFAITPSNSAFVQFQRPDGVWSGVPWDTTLSKGTSNEPIYTRASMGPFLQYPIRLHTSDAAATVYLVVYEYDDKTDAMVNTLWGGQ